MKIITKQERCFALLALHLQQQNDSSVDAGSTPSVEELEALSGMNEIQLDELRRQQLLQHLVHDEKVYKLWLETIEYNHSFEASLANNTNNAKPNRHFRQNIVISALTSFKNRFNKLIPACGAATAMAAALIALTLLPESTDSYQTKIDTIASNYSEFSINSSLPALPSRSAGLSVAEKTMPPVINPAKLLITQGVQQGLTRLNKSLEAPHNQHRQQALKSNTLTQKVPPKDQDMLVSLGQLATLTHYQCLHRNQHPGFTQEALPVYQELVNQLISLNYMELTPLKRLDSLNIQDTKKVCLYSQFVMEELNYVVN